jgi:hypothetical protein
MLINIQNPQTLKKRINAIPLFQWIQLRRRSTRSLRSQRFSLVLVLPAKVCSGTNLLVVAVIANDRYYGDYTIVV